MFANDLLVLKVFVIFACSFIALTLELIVFILFAAATFKTHSSLKQTGASC